MPAAKKTGRGKPFTPFELYIIFCYSVWGLFKKSFRWQHVAFLLCVYAFIGNSLIHYVFVENYGRALVAYDVPDIYFHVGRIKGDYPLWDEGGYPPFFHLFVRTWTQIYRSDTLHTLAWMVPFLMWIILPASIYYLSKEYWGDCNKAGMSVVLYLLGTSFTNFASMMATWPHALSIVFLLAGIKFMLRNLRDPRLSWLTCILVFGFLCTSTHAITSVLYWTLFLAYSIISRRVPEVIISSTTLALFVVTGLINRLKGYVSMRLDNIPQDNIGTALPFLLVWANPVLVYAAVQEMWSWSWRPEEKLLLVAAVVLPLVGFPIDPAYRPLHLFAIMCAVIAPAAIARLWSRYPMQVTAWGWLMFLFHFTIFFGNLLKFTGLFWAYGVGEPLYGLNPIIP